MIKLMEDRWKIVDEAGNDMRNADPQVYDELNKDAKYFKPSALANYPTQSFAVEDGSFIRVNNVTLGYSFSPKKLARIKLSRLRIYSTVNNLAVFTNYSGYDPEVNTRTRTPLTPGVDYSAYPKSRSIVFGLNLSL